MDNIISMLNTDHMKSGGGLGIHLSKIRPHGTNMGKATLSFNNWYVSNNYPYLMYNKEKVLHKFSDEFRGFERRIDAERFVLEQFAKCPDGNWEIALRAKKELETLEEDHPEWLI